MPAPRGTGLLRSKRIAIPPATAAFVRSLSVDRAVEHTQSRTRFEDCVEEEPLFIGGKNGLGLDELLCGNPADLEPRRGNLPEERIHTRLRHGIELHEIAGFGLQIDRPLSQRGCLGVKLPEQLHEVFAVLVGQAAQMRRTHWTWTLGHRPAWPGESGRGRLREVDVEECPDRRKVDDDEKDEDTDEKPESH